MVLICWLITALHILIYKRRTAFAHCAAPLLKIWMGVLSCGDTGDADAPCLACAATVLPSHASCMLPLANLFVIGEKEKKLDY